MASQTCTTTCTSTADGTWINSGGTATWSCPNGGTPTTCNCIVLEHDVEIPQNQDVNLAAIHILMKGANANNGGLGSSFLFNNNSVLTMPVGAEIELETASILFPQGSNSNTFIQINGINVWGKNSAYGTLPVNGPATIDESGVVLLPVELIFFQAERQEQGVQLAWATATEVNHDFFEVEKSGDGVAWSAVKRVEGDGDSFLEKQYEWLDEVPFPGENYYRLRQVDLDRKYEFSNVEVVTFERQQDDNLLIVWRKDASELEILLPAAHSGGVFKIWNALGMEVFQSKLPPRDFDVSEDAMVVQFPINRLLPGVYFAGFEAGGSVKTGKFLVP
ncbi:MAG: hypothetical protein AAB316_10840 [Bacteroidota bacterium]